MVGYDINWRAAPGDAILLHPIYLKYSNKALSALADSVSAIQADLQAQKCRQENQEIVAYLSWLYRSMQLAGLV